VDRNNIEVLCLTSEDAATKYEEEARRVAKVSDSTLPLHSPVEDYDMAPRLVNSSSQDEGKMIL